MSDKVQLIKQEIEKQIEEGKVKCQQSKENNDHESLVAWSEHVATCGKLLVFINSLPEELANEDLDIAATSIIKRLGGMEKDDCVSEHELKIFKAAIEWQKKKDQETIEIAEDHAMLAGMNKMKEEMMKDAIESIVEDWCGDSPEITIPLNPQDFKTGDKAKIIIVKEEQ